MALKEEQIRRLVERFYERARDDGVLGPVFARHVDGHWPAHLDTMARFWSSALLRSGRYAGNPRRAHAAIEGLSLAHFTRWLTLFDATARELFDSPVAEDLSRRARAMANGLMHALPDAQRHSLPTTEADHDQATDRPT